MPGLSKRSLNSCAVAVALFILTACQPPDTAAPAASQGKHHVPLSDAELAHATYAGVGDAPVELSDGEWAGAPFAEGGASAPRIGLVRDFRLDGDLTGDGRKETVVLLWSNSGGSGTYDYVAAMGRDADGTPVNLGTAPLGDRVRVWSGEIVAGNAVLDVIQAGPDDAACCPGEKARRTFTLANGALTETATDILGRMTPRDLSDVEWVLQSIDGDPIPEGVEVTLTFAGNRISGASGCNLYSGEIDTGPSPGQIAMRMPMAATMMACAPPVEAIEQRYLDALGAVTGYSLRTRQLTLTAVRDTRLMTLQFASRPL